MAPSRKVHEVRAGLTAMAEGAGLPYRIELWRSGSIDRILGLAAQAGLARAIFKAAKVDFPEDVILLCRGERVIERSPEGK